MAVIDVVKNRTLLDCWYPAFLNSGLSFIQPPDQQQIEKWINANIFDAALREASKRMNVTEAVRLIFYSANSQVVE